MATENGESGDDLDGPTFTIGDPVPQSALHDHPRAAMDKGVSFDEMDYQSEPPFPLRWYEMPRGRVELAVLYTVMCAIHETSPSNLLVVGPDSILRKWESYSCMHVYIQLQD